MGLLDFLQDPNSQLGIGLLAAGGPSTTPANFGQRIQSAVQGVDAQATDDLKRKYLKAQIDESTAQAQARQLQAQRDAAINKVMMSRFGGAGTSPSAVPASGQPMDTGTVPMGTGGAQSFGINPLMSQSSNMQAPGAITSSVPMGQGAPSVASTQGVAGGGFPFSLNDLALLSTAGAKNAGDLFNMYKYQTDGLKRDAGAYYKDPTTGALSYMPQLDKGMTLDGRGNVMPMNGYSSANASIKGAETGATEAAKYPYTVGADRSRQMTQAQLDTQPTIGEDGNTYYTPRATIALGGGAGAGSAGGPGGAGGAGGGFMASRNPITQQSSIAVNDNWIKQTLNPVQEAGKTALDLQNSIQAIRNVGADTGWGAEQKAAAANVLSGLGMAPASAQLYAANAQKFQSIAMDRLQTSLVAQKGTQTEGDAQRAGQTFAALKNTPEANQFILDFAQAKANMDQRKAQYYEQALPLAQKAGDLTRVDREWRKIQGSVWADPVLNQWQGAK